MATLSNSVADSHADCQHGDDRGRALWTFAVTEESGHRFDLGTLSRRIGSDLALRRQFLLPGMPFHAGARPDAAMDSPSLQLAAQASQQVDCGCFVRIDSVLL